MEVQEIKEQLKEIFRTVINNDKWITIHPHGEDSDDYRRIKLEDGETPKEAIDRVYKKEDKSDTKDGGDKAKKEYPSRHAEILYKDLPELREKLHKAKYERAKNKEKGADVSLYDKRIKEYEDKEQQLKDEMAELRDNRRSQKERYTSLIEEQKQSDTKDGKSSDENIKSKIQKSIEQNKKTAKNPKFYDGFNVVVKDGIVKVEKDGKLSKTGFKYDDGATDDKGEDWNTGALGNLIQKWNTENPKQSDTKDKFGDKGFKKDEKSDRWHLEKDGEMHTIVKTAPGKYRYNVTEWDKEKGSGKELFDKLGLSEEELKKEISEFEKKNDKKEDIYEYLRQQTKQGSDIEKELTAKIKETKEAEKEKIKKYHFDNEYGVNSDVKKHQQYWEMYYNDTDTSIDDLVEQYNDLMLKAGSWNSNETGKMSAVAKILKEKDADWRKKYRDSTASTESEIKEALSKAKSDSKGEKKYNYTLTKREVESNKMFGGMADTGNYYTNGDFAIDKKYLNIKGQEPTKKEEIEKPLKHILKGDSTYRYTPVKDFEIGELKREYGKPIKVAKYSYYDEKYGYERNIYLNKKYNDLFKNFDLKFGGEAEPVFAYKGKDIVGVVMPINAREQSYSKTVNNEIEEELTEDKNQLKLKIDNSKEQDMALLEEIKKLITRVENNKENEMEIENAKVDKRDIIRQIMAIAGKEEASEDVKTIAKLAEKLAYDKSEAGTADNEMDKEDPDDEKEVKEVKEEIKEDVENKCKNSVDNSKTDYFAEMNKIYNAAQEAKKENIYISQAQREQDAVDYFKK